MDIAQTISYLRAQGLTYCGRTGKLETVHAAVKLVEANAVPGIMLEAGVAMGGSASIIAKTKTPERELWLFDVYEMLPPPSGADDARSHEVYRNFVAGTAASATDLNYLRNVRDLLSFTRENLQKTGVDPERANIKFFKGLFADTLVVTQPVAFAHIDCDWYESVQLCIERLADRMSTGGVLLFDDYNSFAGCRKAVDEWLARDSRFRILHADWTIAIERIR